MSLAEHVQKIGALYYAIDRANSDANRATDILNEMRGRISLRFDAEFGEVPVLSDNYLRGIDSVFLQIDYRSGSQTPRFRFEKRHVQNWGDGYFKEETDQPDEAVRVVIDVRPNKRKRDSVWDEFDTMRFELRGGDRLDLECHQTAREFHYMMNVINERDEHIQRNRDRGYQNIAESGIGSVMNTDCYTNGITFHLGMGPSLDLKGRLDYISRALKSFFTLKGYQSVEEFEVGKLHKLYIGKLNIEKKDAEKRVCEFFAQLEQEDVLKLGRDGVGFLRDYLNSLKPLLEKYTTLRKRYGEDLELDPIKALVEALPTNGTGSVEDLASYTSGLKKAVREEDHDAFLRKLKFVWEELIGFDKRVSPDYHPHSEGSDVEIVRLLTTT